MDLPTLAILARLAISIAIGLAFLGVVIVVAALVGTLRTDRPRCRRCGHCLRSFGDVLDRCPGCGVECSSGSNVRFGPRRRHPRAAAIGALLVILAWGLGVAGSALSLHVDETNAEQAKALAARQSQGAALGALWTPSTPLELLSAKVLPRRDGSRVSLELVLGVPASRRGGGGIAAWRVAITSIRVLGVGSAEEDSGGDGSTAEIDGNPRWRLEDASGHDEVIVLLADLPAIGERKEVVLELHGTFSGGEPLQWRYEQVDLERRDLPATEPSP